MEKISTSSKIDGGILTFIPTQLSIGPKRVILSLKHHMD